MVPDWFFYLLVGLAVITVVGHLIWLGLAWLFRSLLGLPARRASDEPQRCPFCDHWTPRSRPRCDWCARDLRSPTAVELADLAALERQLKRLRQAGAITQGQVEELLKEAEKYRRGLIEPRPAAATPSAPTAEPVAERPGWPAVPRPVQGPPAARPVAPGVGEGPAKPWAPPVATPGRPSKSEAAAPVTKPKPPAELRAQPAPVTKPKPPAEPKAQPTPRPKLELPLPKPPLPVEPEPPRKSWKETLTAFLEERNIRWAELILLVAGLLIVGPSVALVISLWETLEQIPIFKFLIFVGVGCVFFGIGLYAYHRWKLEQTGRALLLSATLLVPLNFLAMASLSKDDWSLLHLGWAVVSLGIFWYLATWAARVLVPKGAWLQAGAVVGSSAAVLLNGWLDVPRLADWLFLSLACLPVAIFAGATAGSLHRLADRKDLDAGRLIQLFSLLGTAAFAMMVAAGLLVARGVQAQGMGVTLGRASLPLALAALPILAAGLTVVRGTSADRSLGGYRAAGTAIALLGISIMVAALGMAWPRPLAIMAVGTFNAAALVFVAFRYRLRVAHAGAIACAALVYLTGYHVVAGNLPWAPSDEAGLEMARLAVTAESGTALLGLFLLLGAAAEGLARAGYRRDAEQYLGGSAVVAAVSLLMVSTHALITRGGEAPLATAVFGVYGTLSLLLNARFRSLLLSYFGLGLLAGATIWALWWQTGSVEPLWATILAAEAMVMGLAAGFLHRFADRPPEAAWNAPSPESQRNRLIDAYRIPLMHVAEGLGVLALAVGAWTAWEEWGLVHWTATPVATFVYVAALCMLMAWGYRSAARTWAGSMIVLIGLIHTLVWNYQGWLQQPWLVALLAHATLAVLAGLAAQLWAERRARAELVDDLRRVFVRPLGQTGLLSSWLAVPVLAFISWHDTLSLAACLFWLAAVWLVMAWNHRWPAMFAASQTALSLAVVMATTAWLERHPWSAGAPVDLLDPRSLQVYGIALGLLTLAWVLVRIALRRSAVAAQLLSPGWPGVDRVVGHGVVVLQLLLVAAHLVPGCWQELSKRPGLGVASLAPEAFGPAAWWLLAVLALGLLSALWHRWRETEAASSLLVAATVPCLIAGQFAGDRAIASALRWGLALGFIVCSAAIWQRRRLRQWCRQVGGKIEMGAVGPRISRTVLLATTAAPILILTLLAALERLAGVAPGGPAQGSLFDRLGPEVSYLVPMVLVVVGLVGFALRETSAGYAFSAGLVTKMAVALGYLLAVVLAGNTIGTRQSVMVLQLVTITAAVWAAGWLIARRWVDVWREAAPATTGGGPRPTASHPTGEVSRTSFARALMNLQLGIGSAGNALLLVPALLLLALWPVGSHGWTMAAGSAVGWIALASVAAAAVYRRIQLGRPVRPEVAGLVGMAALGLLACTVRAVPQLAPEWGYRTLMLGWATYSVLVVLGTWWVTTVRTLPDGKGPPQALIRTAAGWVSTAGLLAVFLGLKAAWLHQGREDLLWAAAAIALAAASSAAMSVWRRREDWAFAAALGVNLAASLAVWHYHHTLPFDEWWILLAQANVIATASVALVWLAARRRLYTLREMTIRTSPLLGAQTALAVVGNAVLLALPVASLVAAPADLPSWAAQMAKPPGWTSLLLAAAAAAWYLRQVAPQSLFHVVGGLGLGTGVLVACQAARWTTGLLPDDWFAYHVLGTSWATGGLAVLGVGLLGRNLRLAGQVDPDARPSASTAPRVFAGTLVTNWVSVLGAAAVTLAVIYCVEDPGRPWWSVRAIVAASVTAGLLAMWRRLPGYVYVSGLLVNVAGTVIWLSWEPRTLAGLVYTNVLCLALASCVWSLVRWTHRQGVPALSSEDRPVPFAHLAVQVGLALAGILAAISVAWNVAGIEGVSAIGHAGADSLGWAALAAVVLATAVCLWDRSARFPLPALYCAGLVALGMALDARGLTERAFCWTAGHELAGLVLLMAVLGWMVPRMRPVWAALRIPADQHPPTSDWLPRVQTVVAAVAFVLGVWISIDFGFDGMSRPVIGAISGRMGGPLGAAALLGAAILTAGQSGRRWRTGWQCATFGLGALAMAELGWAWLDPAWFQRTGASAWLHRNVILMSAAVAAMLVAGFGLRRLLPARSDWLGAGRRMVPALGGVGLVFLTVVLIQEGYFFARLDTIPMATSAIIAVGAVLVGLAATCLAMAVLARLDPFHLSDRHRTVYVYLAEVLVALIAIHVRFTAPWLFHGLKDYWMLAVMGLAFGGAALGELFRRLGLPVLSEPLERTAALLPLAPAVIFWLPMVPPASGFAGASPAVWFSAALFYGVMGVIRRSAWWYPLLGLAAGNVGLCVLWHQWEDFGFRQHPQLWLIPVGLSLLVAEHLNRDRLSKAQSAWLRYLALSVVYVSSSVEYLRELGQSVWLPLFLILLSVVGVLAGIVMRVRAFVVLGITFLLMVIVTMIWYAAVDLHHTWVFYLACIGLGGVILAMFAVYEKHRSTILAAIERFRQWE